ncbi:MAG: tetratricopeptide repeat protein [Candidatus Omnitrophota bacterium]
MDNIEEKLRNIEEWNSERAKVKPLLDVAVDCHNKARREVQWKNYERALGYYRDAIKNYKEALALKPKYYLQDIVERIDSVVGEHINNIFNLKTSGDALKNENGIKDFLGFVGNLDPEEKRYIDPYEIALAYLRIGDTYREDGDLSGALGFYNRAIETECQRPFVNMDAHFKIGVILFDQKKFKEALISFVSVVSFDRNNEGAIGRIEKCLTELKISEHKSKFLSATPNEAKKLIMEVL